MSTNGLLVCEMTTPLSFGPKNAFALHEFKTNFESSEKLLRHINTNSITFPGFTMHLPRHWR